MNRAELALQVLCEDPVPHTVPCTDDSAEFLALYPAGFAPVGLAEDGGRLRFSPARIVQVGEGLSDRQFRRLCEAIVWWQQHSIVGFGLQHPADLVVLKFVDDYPDDGTVLSVVARRNGMSLVRFLGADRGTGLHT